MSDALTNAVSAFGTINNAFQQDREFKRQEGLDVERREGAIQERRLRDVQIQDAEHGLAQKRLLDDVNYTHARVRELSEAYQTDEDTYNAHVDKLWADPVFQRTYKAVPELARAVDQSSKMAQTYHEFGQTIADVATNHEGNPDFTDNNGHQEVGGETATKLFGLLNQMEHGNRWPKTVVPGSVKFVSMNGRGDWGVSFNYVNDAGKTVEGVATKGRTKNGEPGSEKDPLVLKSIPELFQETQSKLTMNLALAGLRARAQANEPEARKAIDKMDVDQVQQAVNSERGKKFSAALKTLGSDGEFSDKQIALGAAIAEETDVKTAIDTMKTMKKESKPRNLVKVKEPHPKDPNRYRERLIDQEHPESGYTDKEPAGWLNEHNPKVAGEAKEKNPVLYMITKPDGRTVQIDATSQKGKARLNAAIDAGERVSKLGTESESTTVINLDTGASTTRRVSGPTAKPQAVSAVEAKPKGKKAGVSDVQSAIKGAKTRQQAIDRLKAKGFTHDEQGRSL